MASTGKGSNVEMTISVIQSLSKLANENSSLKEFRLGSGSNHHHHHESMPQDSMMARKSEDVEMEEGEVDMEDTTDSMMTGDDTDTLDYAKYSEDEKTFIQALSSSTTSFSKRCERFQQLLLNLFHANTNAGSPSSTSSSEEMQQKLQDQISTLQSTCNELECQVKELAKARDEANMCERRVRRGLYRVASGRVKIKEVLKVSTRIDTILHLWPVAFVLDSLTF